MCYLLRQQARGCGERGEGTEGRGGSWMMNDSWTASGDKPGKLTPLLPPLPPQSTPSSSSHNQTWQNGDICRNIGYSLRHSPSLALPSLVSAGRPVSRPPNCLRALKHLFQLALPFWPRDFTFSRCHLHITLNQNPQWATGRKGEKKKQESGSGKQNRGVTVQG